MSIFEAIGMGYTLLATAVFTAQLIYFGVKGLTYVQRLIRLGQAEENSDIEQVERIKRELAEGV